MRSISAARLRFADPCASVSRLSRPSREQRLGRCLACSKGSLERSAVGDDGAVTLTCSSSSPSAPTATATTTTSWRTCRHCKRRFDPSDNPPTACRRHPALFTGGEVSKAVGFVRRGHGREHWLDENVGVSGLLRFWDCCGAGSEDAPGCQLGPHEGF